MSNEHRRKMFRASLEIGKGFRLVGPVPPARCSDSQGETPFERGTMRRSTTTATATTEKTMDLCLGRGSKWMGIHVGSDICRARQNKPLGPWILGKAIAKVDRTPMTSPGSGKLRRLTGTGGPLLLTARPDHFRSQLKVSHDVPVGPCLFT